MEVAGSSETLWLSDRDLNNLKKFWLAGSVLPLDIVDIYTSLARHPVLDLCGS
jgi:hypothetical protein